MSYTCTTWGWKWNMQVLQSLYIKVVALPGNIRKDALYQAVHACLQIANKVYFAFSTLISLKMSKCPEKLFKKHYLLASDAQDTVFKSFSWIVQNVCNHVQTEACFQIKKGQPSSPSKKKEYLARDGARVLKSFVLKTTALRHKT